MKNNNKPLHDLINTQKVYVPTKQHKRVKSKYEYELKQLIGWGGFGCVYWAECLDFTTSDPNGPPRYVAIKQFNATVGEMSDSFLRRELSAMLALRHPQIPRVFDWTLEESNAFVVYLYYPRGSLGDALPSMGPADEQEAWRLMADILAALQAAHQASILHLDIKPNNILLDDQGGFALTDFGLAQGNCASSIYDMKGVGTFGYQAPEQEQIDYDLLDVRTDLWSLGATAWAFLTGIDLTANTDVLDAYNFDGLVCRLPRLKDKRHDIDPELEKIVMSLVALKQEERPGSAAEVLANVEARLGGSIPSGFPSAQLQNTNVDNIKVEEVVQNLIDPLWISVCEKPFLQRLIVHYSNGEYLGRAGDRAYHAYVLLKGEVAIERSGRLLAREHREGTFLGEVAALTGHHRTADMKAVGDTYLLVLNAAELERLVLAYPGVAIRLMKNLAERVDRESQKFL